MYRIADTSSFPQPKVKSTPSYPFIASTLRAERKKAPE
jgi:hypothetical protein